MDKFVVYCERHGRWFVLRLEDDGFYTKENTQAFATRSKAEVLQADRRRQERSDKRDAEFWAYSTATNCMIIGTIVGLEPQLESALALYRAAMVLHRKGNA